MEKHDKERMVTLLEGQIRNLKLQYSSLLSRDGKFNALKEIKLKLRDLEDALLGIGMRQ